MQQQKNKKIFIYFFLFLIIGSINNKHLNSFKTPKIKEINISGLDKDERILLSKNLEFFKLKNLLFMDKKILEKIINSNHYVEKYFVFKRYPSSLDIKIEKTKLLAYVNRNGNYFFLGSNKKFIKTNDITKNIPFIFGFFKKEDFFYFKKIIEDSNFELNEIEKLYFFPSGRWDLLTKSGILIKLPKENISDSIMLSQRILNDKKFKNISLIDLRQKNQVITNE